MEGFGLDTQEDLFEQLYCVQSQKNRNKLAKRLIERVDSLGFLQKGGELLRPLSWFTEIARY